MKNIKGWKRVGNVAHDKTVKSATEYRTKDNYHHFYIIKHNRKKYEFRPALISQQRFTRTHSQALKLANKYMKRRK